MVMSSWSMDVTVCEFLCSCITNLNNLNVEIQVDARQRVIAVDSNIIAFNCSYRDYHGLFIGGLPLKLHTDFDFIYRVEYVS